MSDSLRTKIDNLCTRSSGTWGSQSSSSSSTAVRYSLDEEDTSPILTYVYGGDISTTSQKDLCGILDNDPAGRRSRVTKKPIPRFASHLEIKRHDLYLPTEHVEYRKYPNYDSSLASIRLPSSVYWGRALFGQYGDLFIVSPETTPENSEAGSSIDSVSPHESFTAAVPAPVAAPATAAAAATAPAPVGSSTVNDRASSDTSAPASLGAERE